MISLFFSFKAILMNGDIIGRYNKNTKSKSTSQTATFALRKIIKKYIKGNNNATNNKTRKKILLILYILLFTIGYIYDFNNRIINDFIGLFMSYIIQRFFYHIIQL